MTVGGQFRTVPRVSVFSFQFRQLMIQTSALGSQRGFPQARPALLACRLLQGLQACRQPTDPAAVDVLCEVFRESGSTLFRV